MKKIAYATIAAFGAIALPAAAQAQGAAKPEVTIGAQVGLHDLGLETGDADLEGFDIDDSGEIYGGFVAVDFPIGETLFIGAEGNGSFGSGPIDADYGVSARFGLKTKGGSKIYARGVTSGSISTPLNWSASPISMKKTSASAPRLMTISSASASKCR